MVVVATALAMTPPGKPLMKRILYSGIIMTYLGFWLTAYVRATLASRKLNPLQVLEILTWEEFAVSCFIHLGQSSSFIHIQNIILEQWTFLGRAWSQSHYFDIFSGPEDSECVCVPVWLSALSFPEAHSLRVSMFSCIHILRAMQLSTTRVGKLVTCTNACLVNSLIKVSYYSNSYWLVTYCTMSFCQV